MTAAGEGQGLERLLRRDRAVTLAGAGVLTLLAWLYLLTGPGLGMNAWEMTTFSLFPHTAAAMDMTMGAGPGVWSLAHWLVIVAMWWIMMIAMMTPSAAPAILLYGRVFRHAARKQGQRLAPTWAFAFGYLLAWLAFSLAAASLHWGFERAGLVSAQMMGSQSKWLSAAVLAAAGIYQFSPLHRVCLSHCRSPAMFLSRHWRPGAAGAVRLGALHGAYCVGCCWLLMGLLFVGGVMNLAWIAGLALLVLVEKLLPAQRWASPAMGAVMLVWAAATLVV